MTSHARIGYLAQGDYLIHEDAKAPHVRLYCVPEEIVQKGLAVVVSCLSFLIISTSYFPVAPVTDILKPNICQDWIFIINSVDANED